MFTVVLASVSYHMASWTFLVLVWYQLIGIEESITTVVLLNKECSAYQTLIYTIIKPRQNFIIYHQFPTTSSKYSQPISIFLDEFQTYLSSAATAPHKFIIIGDFNIHLDDPLDSSSQQFTDILSSTNLTQHVSVSTHIHNHTQDLVITSHTNVSPTMSQSVITVSDHFPIFHHLNLTPTPHPPPSQITFGHT